MRRKGRKGKGQQMKGRQGERQRGQQGEALENRETDGKQTRLPNIEHLTGDDKSNGNYCGKNIIRNLIEVKQNLHNTAN
jgi:hypothetical protein